MGVKVPGMVLGGDSCSLSWPPLLLMSACSSNGLVDGLASLLCAYLAIAQLSRLSV